MIIYDGEKYACVSCIRGHRSSTCRHANRMLVKVRNRGRHGSLDIRKVIIVDTESQIRPDEHSPACENFTDSSANTDTKECEKMNKQPILFLKTIQSQRAVFSEGKLQIIVEDNGNGKMTDGSGAKGQPGFRYISEKEFLRQHSIDFGNFGNRSGCSCHGQPPKCDGNIATAPALRSNDTDPTIGNDQLPEFKSEMQDTKSIHDLALVTNGRHSCCHVSIDMERTAQVHGNTIDSAGSHKDNRNGDESAHAIANQKPIVELLTHKGLYLSTQCSCGDDSCLCANCLLHRNEEELNSYIQQSGVPLTNLGEAQLANSIGDVSSNNCNCSAEECTCDNCPEHPTEIVSFNKFLFHGMLNVPLKKKSIIIFKGRLIPSQYWWDFLKFQVPLMTEPQLDSLDILAWFDNIISAYSSQLIDVSVNDFSVDTTQALFNV